MRNAQPSPRYMVKRISFLCSGANRRGNKGASCWHVSREIPALGATERLPRVKFEFNSENRTRFAKHHRSSFTLDRGLNRARTTG